MIIWSDNRKNSGHFHKTQTFLIVQQILHFCIRNYLKIFEYSNILHYSNIVRIYFTAQIIFIIRFTNNIRYLIWSKIDIHLNTDANSDRTSNELVWKIVESII